MQRTTESLSNLLTTCWPLSFRGQCSLTDLARAPSNGIVEAVRLAMQNEVAGDNSYRSSIVKVLDGPAAYLLGVRTP